MSGSLNIWLVIAGVGIFLMGVRMLETGLRSIMGRKFKLFLKRQVSHPLKAVLGGTVVTALLQSSSAVNFMVLAFVSTGVFNLSNGLAVILGNNLGTTFTGWIIATIGFKLQIEVVAFPLIGIAGVVWFIFKDNQKVSNITSFFIGFALLFIGLDYMKSAVESEFIRNMFSQFGGNNNLTFLLIGFVATTITQSSAATVAITLSLLHQNLIAFDAGVAVVIGSEVGTSIKLILGAMDGIALKRQVAFGNLFFNIITTIIGIVFLQQIVFFITESINIQDPLIGLMVFQSGINFLTIIVFIPFIKPFSILLEKWFSDEKEHASVYINKSVPYVPELALDIIKKEAELFIFRSMYFNLHALQLKYPEIITTQHGKDYTADLHMQGKSFDDQYIFLKQHHGEIQNYYMQMLKQSASDEIRGEMEQEITQVRSAMHSAKCIKDVQMDIKELRNSSHDTKFDFYKIIQQQTQKIYKEINASFDEKDKNQTSELLMQLLVKIKQHYKDNLQDIYKSEEAHTIAHVEIATLMNLNREMFTGNKSMVMSLINLLLPTALQKPFGELATYQP